MPSMNCAGPTFEFSKKGLLGTPKRVGAGYYTTG
jgi:hypothetical protein